MTAPAGVEIKQDEILEQIVIEDQIHVEVGLMTKTQSSGGSLEGHRPCTTVTRYLFIVDSARRPY